MGDAAAFGGDEAGSEVELAGQQACEVIAIEFEIDVRNADCVDVSCGCRRRTYEQRGVRFIRWRSRMAGIRMSPVDSEEGVLDLVAFGAVFAVEGFQGEIGYVEIG